MRSFAVVFQKTYSHALRRDAVQAETLTSRTAGIALFKTITVYVKFATSQTCPAFARDMRFRGEVVG